MLNQVEETRELTEEMVHLLRGPKPPQPTLSPQPFLALIENGTFESDSHLGVHLGVSREVIRAWWRGRRISLWAGEAIAETIGLHPFNIWGAEYTFAIYSAEKASEWDRENRRRNSKKRRIDRKMKNEEKESGGRSKTAHARTKRRTPKENSFFHH